MKVGIIHGGGQPDQMVDFLQRSFSRNRIRVDLIDINSLFYINGSFNLNNEALRELVEGNYSGLLNRVVPSSQSDAQIRAVLEATSHLEERGLPILNPVQAAQADYSKLSNCQSLKDKTIPTPETVAITSSSDYLAFIEQYGLPLITKDDLGGKGISVKKITTPSELEQTVEEALSEGKGKVLQEFIQPSRPYDCRVIVVNGEVLFTYGRTLVGNGSGAWKGCKDAGSEIVEYTASPEEIAVALASTDAINAGINATDLYFSEKGPVVIENNPTPGYRTGQLDLWKKFSGQVVELATQWLETRKEELQPESAAPSLVPTPERKSFYFMEPAFAT